MMREDKNRFPKIKKSINDFINDEDGSITRSKLITVGSMVLLMTIIAGIEAYAAHSSHRSHSSHSSHSSGGYGGGGHYSHTSHQSHSSSYHGSLGSHSNHANHSSHGSHANHSNHSSHANSLSPSDVPKVLTPKSTVKYAGTTFNDKISAAVPEVSDAVNTASPGEVQAVDSSPADAE